jgi:hypothetical protein
MTIAIICLICVLQIFGLRHASFFLRKEILKESRVDTYERIKRLTGVHVKFPMSTKQRGDYQAHLRSIEKEGLSVQCKTIPIFVLGFSMFIVGPLLLLNFEIPLISNEGSWTGLLLTASGIFVIFLGIKGAFPGMLKEFSASAALSSLDKSGKVSKV